MSDSDVRLAIDFINDARTKLDNGDDADHELAAALDALEQHLDPVEDFDEPG